MGISKKAFFQKILITSSSSYCRMQKFLLLHCLRFHHRRSPSLFKFSLRSSHHQEVFTGKGVLKISSKFTGEHPCRSVISKKLQSNLIEISLRHGSSPVNLEQIFRTPFSMNTSGRLLLFSEHSQDHLWRSQFSV